MDGVTIEVVKDGNIEQCRELCDELMRFQKSKAVIAPEGFDFMNFDTRMKPSYDNALNSQVVIVKRNEVPEGYIFSTVEDVRQGDKSSIPDWLHDSVKKRIEEQGSFMGFYPHWENLPEKCGCLNHLYLRESLRGTGLGVKLTDIAMEWFKSVSLDLVFVYISNGNDSALNFYLKYGFTYSHDVFGGFIKAAYMKI